MERLGIKNMGSGPSMLLTLKVLNTVFADPPWMGLMDICWQDCQC